MKKIYKCLIALALVLSLAVGGLTSVYAVTSEGLNNKQDENATQVEKVDGTNHTGSFRVNMSDSHDTITVYQLAEMKWDDANHTFQTPEWLQVIKNWLGAGGDGNAKFGAYDTPEKLAAATTAIQSEFFKAVLGADETITAPVLTATDAANIVKTEGKDKITVSDSTYGTIGLTKGTGYQRTDGATTDIYMLGDTYSADSGDVTLTGENVVSVAPALKAIDIYYAAATPTQRYMEGDVYQEAENGYFTVSGVDIGIYGIVGASDGKTYAPATVNLIPRRDGAVGNWYLSQEIATNLKAANVTMEKTINGKKTDIVKIGEDVDFEITYTLPKYAAREINNSTAQYTLTFDDELSDAFSLDQNSVVVKYRTDEGTEWTDASVFDPDYYSSFISAPATDTNGDGSAEDEYGLLLYGCSVSHLNLYTIYRNAYKHYITTSDSGLAGYVASDGAHSKPYVTGATWEAESQSYFLKYYAYYYYRDGAYHLLKNDTANKAYPTYYGSGTNVNVPVTPGTATLSADQVRAVYSAETRDTIGHGWQYFPYGTGAYHASTDSYYHNVFNITFDYAKIMADPLLYGEGKNVTVQITYKAKVNKNINTGVETNTNKAIMKYEANGAGTSFTTIEDTVNAYTYGVNVVKVDGETANETTKTYIAGAQFRLYKETDTFIATGGTAGDANATYAGSMADSNTDGLAGTTLETYKASHTGDDDYYYYDFTADAAGTLDSQNGGTPVSYAAGDRVVRVFELYTLADNTGTVFDGTIISTNTADGVNIKGLDTGNYVLKETEAPAGYNKLAEDMLFSIYALSADIADTTYSGSYAVYADSADGTTITDDDGLYPLSVLNYKGLTLPSTGGMGTLLFTILGLLLMVLAIVFVIRKSKKSRKNITAFLAILLIVGITVSTNVQEVYGITEVTLSNQYGQKVDGVGTVNFKIDLKNEGDAVEIYRIGNLEWQADKNTYSGPNWELGIQNAVDASTDYKTVAATPVTLGAADTATQIAFLDWVYENRATNNLTQGCKVADANIKLADDKMSYTVSGVNYGIYLIKAKNSTTQKDYQLLTVDAMPTQQGPVGNWYLKDNIVATLKFSDIVVDKKIDGKTGETVKTGQNVKFDITGEVPQYPGVDDGTGTLVYTDYPYAVTDTMAPAFEYDEAAGLTIEYTTGATNSEGETIWTTVPEANYTALFKKAAPDTNSAGIMLYKDNLNNAFLYCDVTKEATNTMTWYAYNPAKGVLTKLGTTTSNAAPPASFSEPTITAAYVAATGLTTVTRFTRATAAEFVGLQNVTFDYDYLHTQNATNIRISYQAKVTTSAVVGDDSNTNTATFFYQKNLAGDTGTKDATAYAWTYAINVVKSDGDKANTYLADAKFKLYQEAYTFVPNGDGLGTDSADYSNYAYSTSVNGYDGTYTTLADLDAEVGGDYYYRIVNLTADECSDATCSATGEHAHIVAYKLYTYKDAADNDATEITSVATADGVTITGLAPASYVLIETEAPSGYNRLEEALRFEINEITPAQAQALYSSESLKGFMSEETYTADEIAADTSLKYVTVVEGGNEVYYKAYVDGVYPIDVKNYAGLVLPSTGGVGTLLFTIIGIVLMAGVMLLILRNRKKETFE